jgi:hypothetical protein
MEFIIKMDTLLESDVYTDHKSGYSISESYSSCRDEALQFESIEYSVSKSLAFVIYVI